MYGQKKKKKNKGVQTDIDELYCKASLTFHLTYYGRQVILVGQLRGKKINKTPELS